MELIAREARRVSLAIFDNPDQLDDVDAILVIEILSFVNRRGSSLTPAHRVAIKAIVALSKTDQGQLARLLMADLTV